MSLVEVKVPDIGDIADVSVIELLVKPGDNVKAEQSLVTVESDKASMEIPSTHAGVVKELKVKLGDKVKEGSVLLVLEGADAASPPPPPGEGRVGAQAPTTSPPPPPSPKEGGSKALPAPAQSLTPDALPAGRAVSDDGIDADRALDRVARVADVGRA